MAPNNEPGGAISQDVTTLTGGAYNSSFAHGAISQGRPQMLLALVLNTAGGGTPSILTSQLCGVHGTQNLSTMMTSYDMFFTAASAQTRVIFADAGTRFGISSTNVDGILDSVSLTPIPEPSTYLLMIAGLGIVVFAARRRSKHPRQYRRYCTETSVGTFLLTGTSRVPVADERRAWFSLSRSSAGDSSRRIHVS